jgi:ABC-type lipoprotein release transport system permease subunit
MIKIALKNIKLHRWSSLIVILIFLFASFILYWSFGYSNMISGIIESSNKDSYGDITFFTEYTDIEKVKTILSRYPIKEFNHEKEIRTIIENPKKSDMAIVVELNNTNMPRLQNYIRPIAGRLPEKDNEIAVSEFFKKGVYQLGDKLFLTTSTADKIINAKEYTVVGISKSSAFKAVGNAFMINATSMNDLVQSESKANLFYVYLQDANRSRKEVESLFSQMKKDLQTEGIAINESFMIYERQDKLAVFTNLFAGTKALMIIFIFPLAGAIIAAIVWMFAHRRRKELWTYLALGMKDNKIITLMGAETFFLSLGGSLAGIALGRFSSFLCEKANLWVDFSYSMVTPLKAVIRGYDIAVILAFLVLGSLIWALPPLKKIIYARPFEY